MRKLSNWGFRTVIITKETEWASPCYIYTHEMGVIAGELWTMDSGDSIYEPVVYETYCVVYRSLFETNLVMF